jgi:hypothetical protein
MMATGERREKAKTARKRNTKIEIGRRHIHHIYIHLPCSLLSWRVGIGFLGWKLGIYDGFAGIFMNWT